MLRSLSLNGHIVFGIENVFYNISIIFTQKSETLFASHFCTIVKAVLEQEAFPVSSGFCPWLKMRLAEGREEKERSLATYMNKFLVVAGIAKENACHSLRLKVLDLRISVFGRMTRCPFFSFYWSRPPFFLNVLHFEVLCLPL